MTRRAVWWWAAIPAALVILGQIIPWKVFGQGINYATANQGYLQASNGIKYPIFSRWGAQVAHMGWPALRSRLVFSHGSYHLTQKLTPPPQVPGVVSIEPMFHYAPLGPMLYLRLAALAVAVVALAVSRRHQLLPLSRMVVCSASLMVSGAGANVAEVLILGGAIDWLNFTVPLPGREYAQTFLNVPDLAIYAGIATLAISTAWRCWASKEADEQKAEARIA